MKKRPTPSPGRIAKALAADTRKPRPRRVRIPRRRVSKSVIAVATPVENPTVHLETLATGSIKIALKVPNASVRRAGDLAFEELQRLTRLINRWQSDQEHLKLMGGLKPKKDPREAIELMKQTPDEYPGQTPK